MDTDTFIHKCVSRPYTHINTSISTDMIYTLLSLIGDRYYRPTQWFSVYIFSISRPMGNWLKRNTGRSIKFEL